MLVTEEMRDRFGEIRRRADKDTPDNRAPRFSTGDMRLVLMHLDGEAQMQADYAAEAKGLWSRVLELEAADTYRQMADTINLLEAALASEQRHSKWLAKQLDRVCCSGCHDWADMDDGDGLACRNCGEWHPLEYGYTGHEGRDDR